MFFRVLKARAYDRCSERKRDVSHEHEYVNGKSFRFLGCLKVTLGDKNSVDTDGLFLFLTVKEKKEELKKQTVEHWFDKIWEKEIGSVCREMHRYFEKEIYLFRRFVSAP